MSSLGLFLTLIQYRVEIGVDLLADLLPEVHLLGRIPWRAHDAVLESEKRVELLPRQAHQPQKDRGWEKYRQLLAEVAAAAIDERIDEMVHPRGHVVFNGIHLLRRKEGIEDLAVLEVLGRVDTERNERAHVAQLHEVPRGVALGIAQHLVDGGPARHHDKPFSRTNDPAVLEQGLVLRLWLDQVEEVVEPLLIAPEHRRGLVLAL